MKQKSSFFSTFLFVLFLLGIVALRLFVLSPVRVSGHSMDPTLADGQRLMVFRQGEIQRGDIIVTHEPDDPDREVVKRVIGLPGDTVTMQNDQLTINGSAVAEPYLTEYQNKLKDGTLVDAYAFDPAFQAVAQKATKFTQEDFSVTVSDGYYFVLGDNRLVSKDSRRFGQVATDLVVGKVIFSYWPIDRFGGV